MHYADYRKKPYLRSTNIHHMNHTFTPAVTIDEVIEQLEIIIADCIKNNDQSGYFAALYKRVTVAVKEKIAEGYFADNTRMEQLDVIFANRYLEAHHGWVNKQEITKSWKLAFETAKRWRPLVIQHLLVGMNAHIALDLGIAAATVQPENIEELKGDFDKINVVLNDLTNTVQDELAQIFTPMKFLDRLAGGADEFIAGFAMEIARDAAWQVALDYHNTPDLQRPAYLIERDKVVCTFGKKVVSPGKWINFLTAIIRIFERGTIRKKIEILNQPEKSANS